MILLAHHEAAVYQALIALPAVAMLVRAWLAVRAAPIPTHHTHKDPSSKEQNHDV